MHSSSVILKDFLDHLEDKKKKNLIDYLTADEKEFLEELPSASFFPSQGLFTMEKRLSFIHYTWWIPFLDTLEDTDKYLFISALPEGMHPSLHTHYDLSRKDIKIKKEVQGFFQSILYEKLTSENPPLLLECLPHHSLNDLLFLSRDQLLAMIDLLSIHDLSIELKTLISASHLEKINEILTENQKGYFHLIRGKKEPLAFTPIGISRWNGDSAILKRILHQRGLNRLAKALSLCHLSLQWHFLHKLDTGRAASVEALIKDLKNKKAHDYLVSQVCEIMNTLQA